MDDSRIFIVGSLGQLGTALRELFPNAAYGDRDEFDITDTAAYESFDWGAYDVFINAAAMTNVDGAETANGRKLAWQLNAYAASLMSIYTNKHKKKLVHVSSDYVFDGTQKPHIENEQLSPLSVYGASKAAGDLCVQVNPQHYIVRTTWVVGKGKNFIGTMWDLAHREVKPSVVSDQIGRLTFTEDLALAISYLLENNVEYGTYNMTNDGENVSWADIAKLVYIAAGKSAEDVTGVSTTEYYAGKEGIAPRPLQSEMDLTKIKGAGFTPRNWRDALDEYLEELKKETN